MSVNYLGEEFLLNYISLSFSILVIVLVILYYVLPNKVNIRGTALLIGSLFFYLSFDLKYSIFLAFTAISTYLAALKMQDCLSKKKVLINCITANVFIWFVIKVMPWVVEVNYSILNLFGFDFKLDNSAIIVPVGISYFTLQAIGYIADVYKGITLPEKSFWKYLLFITYFPAIVQGPISRYNNLMPQLLNKEEYSFERMRKGLTLILFGLVKKVVVADRLGLLVDAGYGSYSDLDGGVLYLVAICYSVQLYMDFSGCVDICRGVSSLFNVELINNFNRPYLATSIKDFWSKWHISLSSWLKDYIYIPLGGNRKGAARKYINLLITFLVSGIWHGAGFSFLMWGGLHAVFQIIGQATAEFRNKVKSKMGIAPGSVSEHMYQIIITFNLVNFAWIFFRAPSFMTAVHYIHRMFTKLNPAGLFDGTIYELGISQTYFFILILHFIVFFVVEKYTKSQNSAIEGILHHHVIIRWVVYIILIFDIILFGAYGSGYDLSGFMYGGF